MKKKNLYIEEILGKPIYEFEKFHIKTKIKKMEAGIDQKLWPKEWSIKFHKGYSRFAEIKLPKPRLSSKLSLKNALESRVSSREFSKKPMSRKQLSNLFYYSAGILPSNESFSERRFYPSAGARYPIEVYFLSLNTELPQAYYHYYVKNNSFERLFDFKKKDLSKITSIDWAGVAGGIIFLSAVFRRNTNKYLDRGYRHVLAEAGHIAQNFYLVGGASGISCCSIGGYIDDGINNLLDLDGLEESVLYTIVVGSQKK